ncbi:hypothetical protein ABT072_42810 [Streptomyces sp. NPDC002589]|uniref:hypothetical protein n=1 Tax=Streptomyces sp. NPDC002589 TaxID=3154420 RepID=UPI00332E73CA
MEAVAGLTPDETPDAVAAQLGDALAPAPRTLIMAVRMQAGALGVPAAAVAGFGGFESQCEQIEKVAGHYGNYWRCCCTGICSRTDPPCTT